MPGAADDPRQGSSGVSEEDTAAGRAPSPGQLRVCEHREGALLLSGPAGSGKTEALARRLEAMAARGEDPGAALAITSTQATATRLRDRAEELIAVPGSEIRVATWEATAERLLREEATAAGLDPFFEVLGPAERLATLLERLEELPLRLHEIRGNPAGLLGGLLRRIDSHKVEGLTASELAAQARRLAAAADDQAGRESAERELEFAELYAAHDRILAGSGCLDQGDLLLVLRRLLAERADARARIRTRFPHLLIDELEDLGPARWAVLDGLAAEPASLVAALDEDADRDDAAGRFAELHPGAERVRAETAHRSSARVRFWRCATPQAEAQSVAREIEELVGSGTDPESIAVFVESPAREGSQVAAALEERSIPSSLTDPVALFRRPEVRDTIAWLRVLADPEDSAAAARALTRPPVQLPSADMARLTTIARRRKLDLVAACEAALESPQFKPEARERIEEFLRLHRAASAAIDERRADVFVRRLIERIGLRRQRMFAARAEVAERLISLSRLAERASAWARREPGRSTRDFVRHLSAIADAGTELSPGIEPPRPGSVAIVALERAKGLELSHAFVLGLTSSSAAGDRELATAMTRASEGLVLSWPESSGQGQAPNRPAPSYVEARSLLEGEEERREEELFGPAEGLHATYRMLREDVLEASWLAGRQLLEPRLDIAVDLNRAVARYLELLELAALIQRPEDQPVGEAIEAVKGILGQAATPEQQAELESSSLDDYLLEGEREHRRRRDLVAARQEPSLEAFLPRSGEGMRLSATDLDLYLTCPLKYKFARVFSLPQEPTINQRFGILIHSVLDRFHRDHSKEELADPGSLARLTALLESGWRRSGFGASDDELQFRDRAREAIQRYWEREREAEGEPIWLERSFQMRVGPHLVRGRVDRVDRLPSGEHELIDYKTGARKSPEDLVDDLQLALYRLAARRAWDLEAGRGSYYYVLDAEKVSVDPQPDDGERVERTVMEVGEGVMSQDFEPKPSPAVCSWCDYRLVCPAAEE